MSDEKRLERLRFRSWHRGTREMDLLLGSFADAYLASFSSEQLDMYEAMLNENDPDLYNWIIGKDRLPTELQNSVMQKLCGHHYVGKKEN